MDESAINHKISTLEIAWAAGFIEGEGSFGYPSPKVTAAQVQREPIDRLQRIFGGKISQRTTRGFSGKKIWIWALSSHRSVEVMMTIYVLMSPKRRGEIERTLFAWKSARLFRRTGADVCARGHSLTGYNALLVDGYIKCRACKNLARRMRRAGNSIDRLFHL